MDDEQLSNMKQKNDNDNDNEQNNNEQNDNNDNNNICIKNDYRISSYKKPKNTQNRLEKSLGKMSYQNGEYKVRYENYIQNNEKEEELFNSLCIEYFNL